MPIKFHPFTPLYFSYAIIHLPACQVQLSLSMCNIFNQTFVICPSNSIPVHLDFPYKIIHLPTCQILLSLSVCNIFNQAVAICPSNSIPLPHHASLMKSFIYQLAQFYFLFQFATYSMLERPLAIVKPHKHRHFTGNMPTIDLQETEPISPDIDILQQIRWH